MVRILFKNVLKTTVTHTGTKIEYAMPRKNNCLISLSKEKKPKVNFDNAKIITFSKKSPLKKLNIDQALVEYNKQTGVCTFSFWNKGKILIEAENNKEDIKMIRYYLDFLSIVRH